MKTLVDVTAWACVLAALVMCAGCGEADVSWIAPAFCGALSVLFGFVGWAIHDSNRAGMLDR